jgi:hypothetical protein
MTSKKGTCFVVMGFNKKTDFETGRTLDLDKSYQNMIKPAVEAAGLECVRADEIVHSGLIDVPMYQQLLEADVVVADLSTANKNAFYELGVRHALRPYTTVVICEDGAKSPPFDVNHIVIRQYHHLGEDIGYDEAMRFRAKLTEEIKDILKKEPSQRRDSPVYEFIKRLQPPRVAEDEGLGPVSRSAPGTPSSFAPAASFAAPGGGADVAHTHSMLMQQVDEEQKKGNFEAAKGFLSSARLLMKLQAPDKPEDPYMLQRLALLTYKREFPSDEDAIKGLTEARELLMLLDPDTSNDTETLAMWGAVHKRLCDLMKEKAATDEAVRGYLDEAVRGYERGFYLRNDYYNGINLAYMLNVRAAAETERPAEAIADYVQAGRVRREVAAICRRWLANNSIDEGASAEALKQFQRGKYWVLATLAEAYFGLADEANGQKWLAEAYSAEPEPWMKKTTEEQIAKLKQLLADSPLKRIC